MRVLAGDIGGTKTYLAIYESAGGGELREVEHARYQSGSYPGLAPMAKLFLGSHGQPVEAAAFGVAGPVVNDTCKATNLPWRLDARVLERELGIEHVGLFNDFHTIGIGVTALAPTDVEVLQDRPADPQGVIAVIGAGTGLGEAIVIPAAAPDQLPRVIVSEGGHCDLAPRNETEIELLRFLLARHERVSYERVVSGPGLVTLYEFVVTSGLAEETESIRSQLGADDPAAVIGQSAVDGTDAACVRAVDLFVSLYGAEAGNLALKCLPSGGVYVAGGVAPKLISKLRGGDFLRAMKAKGRMSPLIDNMRIAVVMNSKVGVLGASIAAARLARQPTRR